jgi:transcriptional antiterminator NusG
MDLSLFDERWFAIQVRPRHEFLAASILRHKGFREFLPTYKSKRQWSDRRKEIELPFFPGYIFCRFSSQVHAPILTTPGVIRIVGINSAIPDSEIEAIQAIVSLRIPATPCSYLKIGTRVQVIAGPLAGIQGILLSYRNHHSLILSVTLVQNSISVEIEHTNVTPIHENTYRPTDEEQRAICRQVA